MNERDTIH